VIHAAGDLDSTSAASAGTVGPAARICSPVGARRADLLDGGVIIWSTNLRLFAVLYWELDRRGPRRPAAPAHVRRPRLHVSQMTDDRCAGGLGRSLKRARPSSITLGWLPRRPGVLVTSLGLV
jgi:hypothetical protein